MRSRRKTLRHESLEERQLLCFGGVCPSPVVAHDFHANEAMVTPPSTHDAFSNVTIPLVGDGVRAANREYFENAFSSTPCTHDHDEHNKEFECDFESTRPLVFYDSRYEDVPLYENAMLIDLAESDFDDSAMMLMTSGGYTPPNVSVTLGNGSLTEISEHLGLPLGESGGVAQQWFTFNVTVSGPATHDVHIKLEGTATYGLMQDYVVTWNNGTNDVFISTTGDVFTLPTSGGSNMEFKIIPINDNIVEAHETITVSIVPKNVTDPGASAPSGATGAAYTVTGNPVTVKILDDDTLTLEKVKFLDDLAMVADPGLTAWATDFDWVKGQLAKTNPVAYANGDNYLNTNAWFSGSVDPGITTEVRFVALGFPGGDLYSEWVATGSNLSATDVTALDTFLENYCTLQADYMTGMTLEWELRVNGNNNDVRDVAGVSTNPFYVTRTEPLTGTLYHTVVHIGCKAAKYQPNEQAAFDAIWAEFSGDNICLYSVVMENGVVNDAKAENKLYYYKQAYIQSYSTIQMLLQHKDGTCIAWADFLRDTLRCQGINAISKIIKPNSHEVTEWNGHSIYLESLIAPQDEGMHHSEIPKERQWTNHKIVEYAGSYYDPSYGKAYDTFRDMVNAFSYQYRNYTTGNSNVIIAGTDVDENWLVFEI